MRLDRGRVMLNIRTESPKHCRLVLTSDDDDEIRRSQYVHIKEEQRLQRVRVGF